MKIPLLVIVLLVSAVSFTPAQSAYDRRYATSAGSLLQNMPAPTAAEQAAMNRANIQWQWQQLANKAKKAADQAAAYATQAAIYNNDASKQAAGDASQAAGYAGQAAQDANLGYSSDLQSCVANATQAAAEAKQAAAQAEMDSAVTKLENERDGIVAQLKAKYDPTISDLESQIPALKQKAKDLEGQLSQSERENARLRAKQLFQPKDPWRMLDGKVCNAKDESWYQFTGIIAEVKPHGILVHGEFGPPTETGFGEQTYFVDNFPVQTYPVVDDETITADFNLVAHLSPQASVYHFTNTTIDLRVNTVRRLDYGAIVTSPPPDLVRKWNTVIIADDTNPEITKQINDNRNQQSAIESKLQQLQSDFDREKQPVMAEYEAKIEDVPNEFSKRAKQAEDAKKQAVTDKVLKNNQDLADKGDPYGLLRMGERYRDGEGVPKDLTKASDYLQKAAAAGDPTAADELKKLPGQ